MASSLPPVSTKLIADAEQFIAEFRRAEQAAARGSSKVEAEVNKLSKSLSKKFEIADFGKELLKGFGVGSGFAVIDTVVGKVTEAYAEHQKKLKDIDDTWAEILKKSKEYQLSVMTPQGQVAELERQLDALQNKYQDLVTPKERTLNIATPGGGMLQSKYTAANLGSDEMKGVADTMKEMQDVAIKLAEAKKAVAEATKGENSEEMRRIASLAKASEGMTKLSLDYADAAEAEARGVAAARDWNDEMEKQAEVFRGMADPALKYQKQIEQVVDLQERGKLSAKEAKDAIAELHNEMAKAMNGDTFTKLHEQVFGFADKSLEENTKKTAEAAHDMGWAFSSAFEDAVIAGGKLSDVLAGLFQDIERIFLRKTITEPLGNWMASFFTGSSGGAGFWGSLLGFADGGRPPVGRPSIVGENGPELFVPDSAGTVVPNGATMGGAGNTYVIDARGADVGVVDRLANALRQLAGPGVVEMRSLTALSNHLRRGGQLV